MDGGGQAPAFGNNTDAQLYLFDDTSLAKSREIALCPERNCTTREDGTLALLP